MLSHLLNAQDRPCCDIPEILSEEKPAHMGSRYLLEQLAEGGKREYEDEINE